MVSPSFHHEHPSSPPPLVQSPLPLSATSIHSQASSSTYPASSSYPSNPSPQRPNLPTPPPSDRLPPPKGRTSQHHNGGNKLMKSLRKGKERERNQQTASTGDIEEDWTLEGIPPPSSYHGINGGGRRASSETTQTMESYSKSNTGSQEVLASDEGEKKEKKSKGRGIVKKTSRLFARDKDKEKERSPEYDQHHQSGGTSSLNPIPATRQTSYSSAHSGDSQHSAGSNHSYPRNVNPFPTLTRPMSNQSRSRVTKEYQSHSRRASQDSTASSWRARSIRSGSSPHEIIPPGDIGVPIPSRQGSNLSASVPGLSRNSLPQPGSSSTSAAQQPSSRSPETIPSRMSTWFSHLLPSTSAATIQEGSSPPPIDSPPPLPPSPLRKPPSAAASFLNAARQRAVDGVRHLLDTEAQPDKCQDTIWVMGVGHSGWRPSTPSRSPNSVNLPDLQDGAPGIEERRGSSDSVNKPSPPSKHDSGVLRPSAWSKKQKDQSQTNTNSISSTPPPSKGFSNLFTASTLSLALPASMTSGSPSKDGGSSVTDSPGKSKKDKKEKEVLRWPDQFYDDFKSVVWCTYRSQYAPILSLPNHLLIPSPEAYYSAFGPPADLSVDLNTTGLASSVPGGLSTRPSGTGWSWTRSEGGLTSDAGWGCMLRTGQSMLANALIHLHLGREWRLPPKPSLPPTTPSDLTDLSRYAEYVKILSWFLDDPSPLCPFSVHRMALIGKELGKEVGEWFGPSTAAGALKTLTNSFAPCGLAVSTATDSIIYKSEVYQASNLPSTGWRSSGSTAKSANVWGDKAVLILVGIRLGLDGVNPIYYESIKALFAFPQSVGIAGGRPSSSYYFVGSQANSLFYLDPHLTRPAIPLEIPPAPVMSTPNPTKPEEEEPVMIDPSESIPTTGEVKYKIDVVNVDDISSDESSDSNITSSPSTRVRRAKRNSKQAKRLSAKGTTPPRPTSTHPHSQNGESTPRQSNSKEPAQIPIPSHHPLDELPVEPEMQWWINAYPEQALRTFHCEKVKKMPLSGLDPSMLLGFLVRSESDWEDFVERANKLPHKIFTVQDEPPSWDVDSDAGLESVSEPDEPSLDDEEIENVPISSGRQPDSNTVSSPEESTPEGIENDIVLSKDTTSQAVDIITNKTKNVNIDNEEEGEEEEWTLGGTPSSQKPVLVERPTPSSMSSRQGSWPKPAQDKVPEEQILFPRKEERSIKFPSPTSPTSRNDLENETMKNRRPLLQDQRMRTESWVDPSPVRGEAPNGDSLL
uniref:Autophagy-related protein 4 n=1 Tax=Kwoniella bestiolae CBS 10118 TaxID=1296100 RepID=A0A1B9G9U9_9TREE|nr:hypothetical protein I302_02663 [Kwoniella bestiolae CBS 10118]OCF27814.1 hypothetical protein I302_02663 [Kwoniella bestiolae CBS 10118]